MTEEVDEIQFLKKLVIEQKTIENQLKLLKEACKEREQRKKEIDDTIIKYLKTFDMSHINIEDNDTRIEYVNITRKVPLNRKYIETKLRELLSDETKAMNITASLFDARQKKESVALRTIEHYTTRRKKLKLLGTTTPKLPPQS